MEKTYESLFIDKMNSDGISTNIQEVFIYYYRKLCSGDRGLIPEHNISHVLPESILNIDQLSSFQAYGKAALAKTATIKLNGGLGTTMGLNEPKCVIPVKKDLSFLDIAIKQMRHFNMIHNQAIPMIFMTSFHTDRITRQIIEKYPHIISEIDPTFIHSKFPKILKNACKPVNWPNKPSCEWSPAGHGDLYNSLLTDGILDKLLKKGIRYLFISNIDNLGATLDINLLGYFAEKNLSFLMEVANRTPLDKKGGHLARDNKSGRLILREKAQVSNNDIKQFEDINRYSFFNSNNVWINIKHLKKCLCSQDNFFKLPLIVNEKLVVPTDPTSPEVYQLETAIGAAIGSFDNTKAVLITSKRFRPVKKCDDLFLLWSDIFKLDDKYNLIDILNGKYPDISLDPRYYGTYKQISECFSNGVPSIINCLSLSIKGNISFGADVICKGNVSLLNKKGRQIHIPDGTHLCGDIVF